MGRMRVVSVKAKKRGSMREERMKERGSRAVGVCVFVCVHGASVSRFAGDLSLSNSRREFRPETT